MQVYGRAILPLAVSMPALLMTSSLPTNAIASAWLGCSQGKSTMFGHSSKGYNIHSTHAATYLGMRHG